MQSPATGWRLRSIILAAIALVAVILVAVVTFRSGQPSFHRFVSQPLSDGTRYTFLYPAHLEDVVEGKGGSPNVTNSVTIYKKHRRKRPSVWQLMGTWLRLAVPTDEESVTVVVIPQKAAIVTASRSNAHGAGSGRLWHDEYLVDARTRTQFSLYHRCPDTSRAEFEAHNPTIAKSLQVLPPGASPPSP